MQLIWNFSESFIFEILRSIVRSTIWFDDLMALGKSASIDYFGRSVLGLESSGVSESKIRGI